MKIGHALARLGPEWLPFADAVSEQLPLSKLLRLGLFQVTVGMTLALLAGTLNRIMIVELSMAATLVAAFLALPLLLAPLRAILGHSSDRHVSALGWRRVPYLWFGTLLQFAGFALLPFALLLLDAEAGLTQAQHVAGLAGGGLAFMLLGLGAHTVQTAGLALATDLSAPAQRPRVVSLLYVTFLLGLLTGSLAFSWLLRDFNEIRLIQIIQGAAVVTVVLNGVALWKQEAGGAPTSRTGEQTGFREAWRRLVRTRRTARLLVAVGLGSAGFAMQDVLLEPYGGQIMGLSVGATSLLTAMTALGALGAFAVAARVLTNSGDPNRLAAWGTVVGVFAFALVVIAAPLRSAALLRLGSVFIGFGGGLFSVGTLISCMNLEKSVGSGLAVGAWGAVQATSAGAAIAVGGLLRDVISTAAVRGTFGPGLTGPEAGYIFVYHLEILALFLAMAALGPLVVPRGAPVEIDSDHPPIFGLAELPG